MDRVDGWIEGWRGLINHKGGCRQRRHANASLPPPTKTVSCADWPPQPCRFLQHFAQDFWIEYFMLKSIGQLCCFKLVHKIWKGVRTKYPAHIRMLGQKYGIAVLSPFHEEWRRSSLSWVTFEPRTKWAQIIWQVFLSLFLFRSWLLLTDRRRPRASNFFCKVVQMDYYWQPAGAPSASNDLVSALNNAMLDQHSFLDFLPQCNVVPSTIKAHFERSSAVMFSLPRSLPSLLFFLLRRLYQALPSGFFQV